MRMQLWCKTVGAGTWGRRGVGTLVGGCVWVGARGDLSPSPSLFDSCFSRWPDFFWGGWPEFCFLVAFLCGKTGGGPPCRLGSEAWLAGSPVRTRWLPMAMHMQQRWEVEAGLDTACWSRMARSAAEGGSAEEDEEKWPLRQGTGRVRCRCVLWSPLRFHLTQGVSGSEKQGGWGGPGHGMGEVCPVVWGQVVGNGCVLDGADVGRVARLVQACRWCCSRLGAWAMVCGCGGAVTCLLCGVACLVVWVGKPYENGRKLCLVWCGRSVG
jgi:hypothetical protein